MHYGQVRIHSRNSLIALGVTALAFVPGSGRADEPGIFGRIFRGGGGPPPAKANAPTAGGAALPYGSAPSTASPSGPVSRFDGGAGAGPAYETLADQVATPQPDGSADAGALPKLTPKSRVNRPITNAEPVLTRFALGRSNDGSQFGMFLEIFADGTVLDSEGVHHVRPADLKPVMEAIQGSDFSRIRGHSGAPPTDFIDHVQIIVFDRRLGRLTAHPFSYSGNPQGVDHAVRHLHTALEGLQLKLSRADRPVAAATPADATAAPGPNSGAQSVVPLTTSPAETPSPVARPTFPPSQRVSTR
jgi:hypothetical protein